MLMMRDHSSGDFSRSAVSTVLLLLFGTSGALHITRLDVPPSVENGTESAVLDCAHTLDSDDSKVQLKWYFKDHPDPIYQWIPELNVTRVSPDFRGHLDMEYMADSEDDNAKYRALKILHPTTDMSGQYTCSVLSTDGSDTMSKNMTVFVPPKIFSFSLVHDSQNRTELTCEGIGAFPKPTTTLYLHTDAGVVRVNGSRRVATLRPDGLYDVKATKEFAPVELPSRGVRKFECELEIPGTDYKIQRQIQYDAGILADDDVGIRIMASLLSYMRSLRESMADMMADMFQAFMR